MISKNLCPYSYIEEDHGFPHMTLIMCKLHPEKLWGMEKWECESCQHYQEEKVHIVMFDATEDEYNKLIQASAQKHISVNDIIRTGLVKIGVL